MSIDQVTEIDEVTDELVEAVDKLIPQLSSSAKLLSRSELKQFLNQNGIHLFTFKMDGKIMGMLTLATFTTMTGFRGFIEDVVVDEVARGHGAGAALVEAALQKAKNIGLVNVDLTSRPSREAANRLYVRCGFKQRETNAYRLNL